MTKTKDDDSRIVRFHSYPLDVTEMQALAEAYWRCRWGWFTGWDLPFKIPDSETIAEVIEQLKGDITPDTESVYSGGITLKPGNPIEVWIDKKLAAALEEEMKKLEGSLRIGRITGGVEDDRIRLEVRDQTAAVIAICAEMSVEQFGDLVTGRTVECFIDWNNSGTVGMKQETKEELVPVPEHFDRAEDWKEKALAPFETDGWNARVSDLENAHRSVRQGSNREQRVLFTRHVPR